MLKQQRFEDEQLVSTGSPHARGRAAGEGRSGRDIERGDRDAARWLPADDRRELGLRLGDQLGPQIQRGRLVAAERLGCCRRRRHGRARGRRRANGRWIIR